jgi:hypothetical protein
MDCFKVERIGNIGYVEDFAMVVIAKDEEHAKEIARKESFYFIQSKLKVTKIDITKAQAVLIANTGA